MTTLSLTIRGRLPLCIWLAAGVFYGSGELVHAADGNSPEPIPKVQLTDQQYRDANLWIDVSDRLLNGFLGQPSREQSPVNEVILGTHFSGSSTTDGQLAVHLIPSESSVAMSFCWNGSVASSTCGTNGRASVRSHSTTNIQASKLVRQDNLGWHSQPATAQVNSRSQIMDVSTDGLLGQRIATRRAYQQRPAVDNEVSRRAADRARHELNRRMDETLTTLQGDFDRRVRDPLGERDLLPTVLRRRTDSNSIQFALLQANRSQPGASTPPPPLPEKSRPADLSVRVHASAINNAATSMLAGETFDASELAEQLAGFIRPRSSETDREDTEERWTIRFRKQDPLRAEFHYDRVTLVLHADSFTIGKKAIPSAKIAVTYKLGVSDFMLTGVREGRIQIALLAPGGKADPRLGVRYQVLRSMLRKRFEPVFPETIGWKPMSLSDNEAALGFKIPLDIWIDIESCRSTDDWLSIGLRSSRVQEPRVADHGHSP